MRVSSPIARAPSGDAAVASPAVSLAVETAPPCTAAHLAPGASCSGRLFPRGHGGPTPSPKTDAIYALLLDGKTGAQIRDALGVSLAMVAGVRHRARRHGMLPPPTRPVYGAAVAGRFASGRGGRPASAEIHQDEIVRLARQGLSIRQVAAELGLGRYTVEVAWKAAGIPIRKPSDPKPRLPRVAAPKPVAPKAAPKPRPQPVVEERTPQVQERGIWINASSAKAYEKATALLSRGVEPFDVSSKTRLPLREVYRLQGQMRGRI